MKTFFLVTVAKFILNLVDFEVSLVKDLLSVTITVGGKTVFSRVFDLIPETPDRQVFRAINAKERKQYA